MAKKIALEEHFLCPGFEDYWKTTVGDVDPKIIGGVVCAPQRLRRAALGGDVSRPESSARFCR